MGSSIVHWAKSAASKDLQLGFTHRNISVQWLGKRGLKLAELHTIMDSRKHEIDFNVTERPDFIMLHCGSNDLTVEGITGKDIIEQIKESLLRYQALFTGAIIIWSSILQRRYWHYAPLGAGKLIEKKRNRVNAAVKAFILSNGGKYINNDCYIHAKEVSLFHTDGTHLSNFGNDILLKNWKLALEMFVTTDESFYPKHNAN